MQQNKNQYIQEACLSLELIPQRNYRTFTDVCSRHKNIFKDI